jgi:hypothetical protein
MINIGDKIKGDQVTALPAGAIVVDSNGKPHVRDVPGSTYTLTDGSYIHTNEYTLVWLPESKTDLTDPARLALEMHNAGRMPYARVSTLDETSNKKYYEAAAKFVLEHFVLKGTEKPIVVGSRVKLTQYVSGSISQYDDYLSVGDTGTVQRGLDSDDEYFVEWDNGSHRYAHYTQLVSID